MSTNPFRLHGKRPAPCIGRQDVLSKIADAFDAEDPANVSIFGPKYIGKSVLLSEVAARHARLESGAPNEDSPFDGVVYWDLRHAGITDQDSFYAEFAKALSSELKAFNSAGANLLEMNGTWDAIRLVADELEEKGQRILVVMDNFDALMHVQIPYSAWENIRNLYADIGSIYYLVGSRSSLSDLCSVDQEGYDLSDFPRIFDKNIALRCFTERDQEAMRQTFAEKGVSFGKGSDTELSRWTGGVPSLTALVYRRLWNSTGPSEVVEHTVVQEAVDKLRTEPDLNTTLNELWVDCSEGGKRALAALADPTTADRLQIGQGVSAIAADDLANRGYVQRKGNVVESSCSLIKEHARKYGKAATAIYQLLGTQEAFDEHMPRIPALRLAHVDKERMEQLKEGLFRKAENIIERAHEPDIMIGQVRMFTNAAVDACVEAMCPDDKIPMQWTSRWRTRGNPDQAMEGKVPKATSGRLHLLREATYSAYGLDVPISRASYIVLSYLHDVGNEGQHLTSDLIPVFAHSVSLAVISLCEQLVHELCPVSAP